MKKISYIFITFWIFCEVSPAQNNNYLTDPQSIYHRPYSFSGSSQNYLDNPLFLNHNLSNNPAPQNEPSIRINRVNRNRVVAAWRDFRLGYTNPVIRRIGYSYSTDGGTTWSVSALLPDPLPNHSTQSDPVLTNDNNGNFYLTSTSRDPSNTRGETVVYKSTDFGMTFFELATATSSPSYFEDKEWITCDNVPGSPYLNNLYITWTRIGVGIKFIKSTNGGANWSTLVPVGDNTSGQGSNVAVGTNSFIYVVWGESNGIKFDKSTNGGASFGPDYQLSNVVNQNGFPFICVDYSNRSSRGNVYVVWDDNRNGNFDIWFQRSTDAGISWLSSPIRVNDVIANNQYKAAIQCDTNGYLSIVYYDERTSPGSVNSFWALSVDQGNNWINQRLSDSSFQYISIGSEVRNGEYIGIDAYSNKVLAVWTDDRAGTPNQEIYSSEMSTLVSIANNNGNTPAKFSLFQNYPNPFNPSTNLRYTIPKTTHVSLKVFNILGSQVAEIVEGISAAGDYSVSFDASELSSGVYFYTLIAGDFRETKRMMVLK